MLEIRKRHPVVLGDLRERDDRFGAVGARAGPPGQLHHHAYAVLGLCREHHRSIPTWQLGYQPARSSRMSCARPSAVICSTPKPTRSVPSRPISNTVIPASESALPALTGAIAYACHARSSCATLPVRYCTRPLSEVCANRRLTLDRKSARGSVLTNSTRTPATARLEAPAPADGVACSSSSAPRTCWATNTHVRQSENKNASTTTCPR